MIDNRKIKRAKKTNDFTKCSHYKTQQVKRFLKWAQEDHEDQMVIEKMFDIVETQI